MEIIKTTLISNSSEKVIIKKIHKLIFTHVHESNNDSKEYELIITIKEYND